MRRSGGTGLGLSISVEDANLHEGKLEAWGEVGIGASFRLTLPLVRGKKLGASPLPLEPALRKHPQMRLVDPVAADGAESAPPVASVERAESAERTDSVEHAGGTNGAGPHGVDDSADAGGTEPGQPGDTLFGKSGDVQS
jgi:two-component system sensor histidine kinase MtrB